MVYYNYPIIGNFTVKLKVVAEWEQATLDAGKSITQKTGDFSASLKLHGGCLGAGAGGVLLVPWLHRPLLKGTSTVDCAPVYGTGGNTETHLSLALVRGGPWALQEISPLCYGR